MTTAVPAPARSPKATSIFLAIVFAAVVALCAPALLGLADADYLVVATPFAQWLPALAVIPALRLAGRRDGLRRAWRARPFGGARTWAAIGLVTLAVLAVPALQILIGTAAGVVAWAPAADASALAAWVLPFAVLALLSASGEEFGWRGFLWTEVRNRRGPWLTALAVGLVWAAWHLPLLVAYAVQGDLPWRNAMATTVDLVAASLVLGMARERSGSAWPAAWGHALLNSAIVFASSNLVTPDDTLPDPQFWAYRAIGWAAWVLGAAALFATAGRGRDHRVRRAGRGSCAGTPGAGCGGRRAMRCGVPAITCARS
ncbi:CPBP family intramembrane glutamic endopeptidase [Agromyces arachidis]|uniref:CPBP family intramembrane glutamic endopeptidase n=1 Tax=Agromyces arachidis TaxID=766966 RepID=UPI004056DE1D